MKRFALLAIAASSLCSIAHADPIKILFVGNSYTFGRLDPVMTYNASKVHDLTAAFYDANKAGTNPWEGHPWGGVPGIFKQFTDEVGLNYDVSISARNAASLRGQFLDTANSDWKLRENVATQKWDTVVLQEQSDAALPNGKGKNANLATFNAYADQFEKFIHKGAAQSYKETDLFGNLAACMATGLSAGSCGTTRNIAANPNASASTKVYLTETWARPDMVYAHKITTPDATTVDGSPIVDTSLAGGAAGTPETLYYPTLAAMTADLHADFYAKLASNPNFAGVIPVGDAFQFAFDNALVKSGGFYDANGVYTSPQAGDLMNLWWNDYLHASKYGSYLDALVQFGVITGVNPKVLGANDQAARDLGISQADALTLQRVAAIQIGAVPEPETLALMLGGLGRDGLDREASTALTTMRPATGRVGRALHAVVLAVLAALSAGTSRAADWQPLAVQFAGERDVDAAWSLTPTSQAPVASLPIDRVRGRWVRLTGIRSAPESGISFAVNAWRGDDYLTMGPPARCGPSPEGDRCTAVLWVPPEATRAYAYMAPGSSRGEARAPRVDVAADDVAGPTVLERSQALLSMLKANYYLSDQIDWAAIDQAVSAMGIAPSDFDPAPDVAMYLKTRLPGSKHLTVLPTTAMSSAPTASMPTCGTAPGGIGLVALPGIGAIDGDAPSRYAKTLDDCLMSRPQVTPWVVDLRGNDGGNMAPMIAGLAPLLPAGPLYAFVDGKNRPQGRVGIGPGGLANDGRSIFGPPTPHVGRRTRAPVVVVLGPHCASACEQAANALAARPRTLFVGEPSAGFLSANVVERLDDDYSLALTVSWTADPCGRTIDDRLHPDIPIGRVDDLSPVDLLRVDAVASWLRRAEASSKKPISSGERRSRCSKTSTPTS